MPNDAPAACTALFEELADIVFGHPIDACVDDFLHRLAVVKRKQRVHRLFAHLKRTLPHERRNVTRFEELQFGGQCVGGDQSGEPTHAHLHYRQ